jgi:hypothetical protein
MGQRAVIDRSLTLAALDFPMGWVPEAAPLRPKKGIYFLLPVDKRSISG